jgi:hypothetical protein
MQTIGRPSMHLTMSINCKSDEYREMCASALSSEAVRRADDLVGLLPNASRDSLDSLFELPNLDWNTVRLNGSSYEFHARFYRSHDDADHFIRDGCTNCVDEGDLHIEFVTYDMHDTDTDKSKLRVDYQPRDKRLFLRIDGPGLVYINSPNMMSVVDLEGAEVIISAANRRLTSLEVESFIMITPQGQWIGSASFTEQQRPNGERVFVSRTSSPSQSRNRKNLTKPQPSDGG